MAQPQTLSPATEPPTGAYRWAVVGMLWVICLLNYADRVAIFSVFTVLETEMGLTEVQQGIVGSAFTWAYAAALPLAGLVGDRFNRKALILGGLVFWSLITLATALSTEYWHLLVFRGLEGLGEAFYFPASMSLISDYHGPRTRSRAMGIHQSSVYVGTVLGGSVAGYCAQHFGWRSGFYLFGSLGIILAAALLMLLREPPRQRGAAGSETPVLVWGSITEIISNRMILLLMAVFIGANFVAIIFLTWMPKYLAKNFDMSLSLSGVTATFWFNGASLVGVLCAGWATDRWVTDFRGARMAVQALGLFLGAPLIFLAGWTHTVSTLVLALAGFGFFKGLYDANIWAALFDFVRPPLRATAQGLMNSIGWLGSATGPVIIGAAASRYGMGAALSATSVIYVAVGLLLLVGLLAMRPHRP